MNIKKLNEGLKKVLNEVKERTFADWFGKDLTGQTYEGNIKCNEKEKNSEIYRVSIVVCFIIKLCK